MLLFGHIGLTFGIFYFISVLTKHKFSYPLIIFGAILSDLIDKPMGRIILPLGSGRLIGHTLVFLLILIIIGLSLVSIGRSWQMLVLALAVALHLIEDRMWEQPAILFWPLLGGFHFHKAISISDYTLDLLQGLHPSLSISFISEVAGFLILLAYFAVEVRKHLRGS
jgi:membrane-bound metal-dependent hydrolase YbcI (DUF457 family)